MIMRRIVFALALLGIALTPFLSAQGGDPNYGKPKRINKMIELLEAGQPVYNAVAQGGDGYEEGKALAQTGNDFIIYEMEHGAFEPLKLRDFMRGLVDGGPTKSGHRTPAVVVTLPVLGLDAISVKANHWVIEQVLAAGVHGMTLCHARDPEAVKMFVASARFQFERADLKGADKGIPEGLRGAGGESFAARIWGVSNSKFVELSDPWPMNPKGELILSMKMEDKYALERVGEITRVPGIAWGEWGPGDQAMSLMGLPYLTRFGDADGGGRGRGGRGRGAASTTPAPEGLPPIGEPKLEAARAHIMATMKANHIFPLHSSSINNIEQLIRAGVMVTHGTSVELMNKGRAYTKRQMPY
jgi:4-hydroxy-2-oxoheptanedioate aldolase